WKKNSKSDELQSGICVLSTSAAASPDQQQIGRKQQTSTTKGRWLRNVTQFKMLFRCITHLYVQRFKTDATCWSANPFPHFGEGIVQSVLRHRIAFNRHAEPKTL